MRRPYDLEIFRDEKHGDRSGFLYVRRLHLRNLRPDGSRSRDWICDFVERPKGVDAVVLVLWRRAAAGPEVLLREGLRPALFEGRPPTRVPLPDPRGYFLFTELVAGIVEEGERGEEALRRRAADEAWEEAGFRLAPSAIEFLGSGLFPSPGMTGERFYFMVAEVPAGLAGAPPEGDGSPMEEGARIRWALLSDALRACGTGEIEDGKTEIGLHRLALRLGLLRLDPP